MVYLTNTFSPLMLSAESVNHAKVLPISLAEAREHLSQGVVSAISHEVTAKILSAVLHRDIVFHRMNVSLNAGDVVIAVIPSFRAEVAREFTEEEVLGAPLRCFLILVS